MGKPERSSSLTMRRVLLVLPGALLIGGGLFGIAACREEARAGTLTSVPTAAPPARTDAAIAVADAKDAGALAAVDAGATYDGPLLGALFMQTPIMSDMEWPRKEDEGKKNARVQRLGYIRHGAKVPVLPEAHKKPNCSEGWYELVVGGFVCGKYGTVDMNHPRLKSSPKLPDVTASLPYQYGYNIQNGTPLYRNVPSRDERLRLEPWLAPKKKAKREKPEREREPDEDAESDGMDAGLQLASQRTTDSSDDTPWYLRDYDGGKPMVSLDDLKGEGPVARRMVKGFYLSIDHQLSGGSGMWWKTQSGLLAPYDRVYIQKPPTEFHGIWLTDKTEVVDAGRKITETSGGGVGFILYHKAKKYIVSSDGKHVNPGDSVSRHTAVRLTGAHVTIGGLGYDETTEKWWMRANEGTHTKPHSPPGDLAPGEKWIDVNLTLQTLVAFEGDKPVYATLVSTGRRNLKEKEKDHPTPPGTFRIREKHIAATMDGDGAADGPYSIEDVPWIMYFNGSYALHGAFWHANFGHVQSHGCVNLSPVDARTIFTWTEPRLPEGWHGVWASPEHPGTRVVVHD